MHASPTSRHQHAVVFIDHREARVLFPDRANADEHGAHVIARRADKTKNGHHKPMDRRDLEAVVTNLHGIGEILIAGPSTAKLELFEFLTKHHGHIAAHVVDVIALEHLSLAEVKDFARESFQRTDLWR